MGCEDSPKFDDYSKIEENKASLALNLVSYLSPDEAANSLSVESKNISVIEDDKGINRVGIPPFRIYRLQITDIEIDGFKGSLHLEFLNERLMATWFYPIDYNGFLQTINGLRDKKIIMVPPHTRILTNKNIRGEFYVRWEDVRLRKQDSNYVQKYL